MPEAPPTSPAPPVGLPPSAVDQLTVAAAESAERSRTRARVLRKVQRQSMKLGQDEGRLVAALERCRERRANVAAWLGREGVE